MKLHLGCGKRYIPGLVHVDIEAYSHIDYVRSVENLDFAEDESVEYIYASHVLEYFDQGEVRKVLDEWYRVLVPGGLLRLAVPDFEVLTRLYLNRTVPIEFISGVLQGRMEQNTGIIYHKAIYDHQNLSKLLFSRGFTDIRFWNWRAVKDIPEDDWARSYVPHMDFKNGTLISLNMEAVKK